MVIYNGTSVWNQTCDFFELFEVPAELAKKIYCEPYELLDFSKMSDEELKNKTFFGVVGYLMKHISDPDVTLILTDLILMLTKIERNVTGLRFFEIAFRYLLDAGEGPDLPKAIYNAVQLIEDPKIRGKAMTLADVLRKYGREEGEEKNRREIVLNMLAEGLELPIIAKVTGLSFDQIRQLNAGGA